MNPEENKKPDNPQVYPQSWMRDGTTDNWENGIHLRDHYAGLAMQALIGQIHNISSTKGESIGFYISRLSYGYADEMLKQRENV